MDVASFIASVSFRDECELGVSALFNGVNVHLSSQIAITTSLKLPCYI